MTDEKNFYEWLFQAFLHCPKPMSRQSGEALAEDSSTITAGSLT